MFSNDLYHFKRCPLFLDCVKPKIMKALATLKNVDSATCKNLIVRNLSRILDIRIIDIDIENGIICFLYNGQRAFDQVNKELVRIGHPIQNYTNKFPHITERSGNSDVVNSVSVGRARKPYFAMGRCIQQGIENTESLKFV